MCIFQKRILHLCFILFYCSLISTLTALFRRCYQGSCTSHAFVNLTNKSNQGSFTGEKLTLLSLQYLLHFRASTTLEVKRTPVLRPGRYNSGLLLFTAMPLPIYLALFTSSAATSHFIISVPPFLHLLVSKNNQLQDLKIFFF